MFLLEFLISVIIILLILNMNELVVFGIIFLSNPIFGYEFLWLHIHEEL